MKNNKLILLAMLLCLVLALVCLCACNTHTCGHKCPECGKCTDSACTDTVCADKCPGHSSEPGEFIDYVAQLKLNEGSATKKASATVKMFVDGDTTHFNVNDPEFEEGVLKARYLAVDTPESTGLIEEYGKQASNFTKEKLSSAVSIMVESNTEGWNKDSTGSRYLVFVWYKTSADGEWRNLNLELLQNGLAFAKNTMGNIYGETCIAALNQAKAHKLKCYSGEKDPLFYYGSAQYVSLKKLRCFIEDYNLQMVAFDGVVTKLYNNGVYVENFDEEADMYFGVYVYYGNGAKSEIISALNIGNFVRVVGNVTNFNGSWQVSGLQYDSNNKDGLNTEILELDENIRAHFKVADDGYVYQPYTKITASQFVYGKVSLDFVETEVDDKGEEVEKIVTKQYDFSYATLATTVTMENVYVVDVYTTGSGSSAGAMTLTCNVNGITIKVRTEVLKDNDGKVITASTYQGKTVTIRGLVEWYQPDSEDPSTGSYQIKVLTARDITIQ